MVIMPSSKRPVAIETLRTVIEQSMDAIESAILAAYPREACGYVTASGQVRTCANVPDPTVDQDERLDPSRAFEFSADDAIRLAESLDGPDPAIILFHSHPDAPAQFSRADLDGATIHIRDAERVACDQHRSRMTATSRAATLLSSIS